MKNEPAVELSLNIDSSLALLQEASTEIARLTGELEFQTKRANRADEMHTAAEKNAAILEERLEELKDLLRDKTVETEDLTAQVKALEDTADVEDIMQVIKDSLFGPQMSLLDAYSEARLREAITEIL